MACHAISVKSDGFIYKKMSEFFSTGKHAFNLNTFLWLELDLEIIQNTSEFFSYFPKCVWAYIISPNALDQASLKQLYGHFIPVFNFVLF